MAVIKGAGPCPIPKDNGLPCGVQIGEGEPRGTITTGNAFNPQSSSGHKRCADAWWERKRAVERERNQAMVQRINQRSDGAVNQSDAFSPVQGSFPLEKKEQPKAPGTVIGDMSQGAHFLGDLPEDATPSEAVQYAQGEPIKVLKEEETPHWSQYKPPGVPLLPQSGPQLSEDTPVTSWTALRDPQGQRPTGTAPPQAFYNAPLTNELPQVDAANGQVVFTLGHLQAQVEVEDAEDLFQLLRVHINRARRQRG